MSLELILKGSSEFVDINRAVAVEIKCLEKDLDVSLAVAAAESTVQLEEYLLGFFHR